MTEFSLKEELENPQDMFLINNLSRYEEENTLIISVSNMSFILCKIKFNGLDKIRLYPGPHASVQT